MEWGQVHPVATSLDKPASLNEPRCVQGHSEARGHLSTLDPFLCTPPAITSISELRPSRQFFPVVPLLGRQQHDHDWETGSHARATVEVSLGRDEHPLLCIARPIWRSELVVAAPPSQRHHMFPASCRDGALRVTPHPRSKMFRGTVQVPSTQVVEYLRKYGDWVVT